MSSSLTWIAVCVIAGLALHAGFAAGQDGGAEDAGARAAAFIDAHVAKIKPLEIAVNRAWWKANTTGDDADFAAKEKAQNDLDEALSDAERFAELKSLNDEMRKQPNMPWKIYPDILEANMNA